MSDLPLLFEACWKREGSTLDPMEVEMLLKEPMFCNIWAVCCHHFNKLDKQSDGVKSVVQLADEFKSPWFERWLKSSPAQSESEDATQTPEQLIRDELRHAILTAAQPISALRLAYSIINFWLDLKISGAAAEQELRDAHRQARPQQPHYTSGIVELGALPDIFSLDRISLAHPFQPSFDGWPFTHSPLSEAQKLIISRRKLSGNANRLLLNLFARLKGNNVGHFCGELDLWLVICPSMMDTAPRYQQQEIKPVFLTDPQGVAFVHEYVDYSNNELNHLRHDFEAQASVENIVSQQVEQLRRQEEYTGRNQSLPTNEQQLLASLTLSKNLKESAVLIQKMVKSTVKSMVDARYEQQQRQSNLLQQEMAQARQILSKHEETITAQGREMDPVRLLVLGDMINIPGVSMDADAKHKINAMCKDLETSRNSVAHGANFLVDLQTVHLRWSDFKPTFEIMYGLRFDDALRLNPVSSIPIREIVPYEIESNDRKLIYGTLNVYGWIQCVLGQRQDKALYKAWKAAAYHKQHDPINNCLVADSEMMRQITKEESSTLPRGLKHNNNLTTLKDEAFTAIRAFLGSLQSFLQEPAIKVDQSTNVTGATKPKTMHLEYTHRRRLYCFCKVVIEAVWRAAPKRNSTFEPGITEFGQYDDRLRDPEVEG